MTQLDGTQQGQSQTVGSAVPSPESDQPVFVPQFSVRWERRILSLFENAWVLLLPTATVKITARPARFWPDVFIASTFPRRGLVDSVLAHALILLGGYFVMYSPLLSHPPTLQQTISHTQLTYYNVSEYLPEIQSSEVADQNVRARVADRESPADPTYAPQEIISVPKDADNDRQTIAMPTNVRLHTDIPLPNVVAAMPNLVQPLELPASQSKTPEEVAAPKLTVPPEILHLATSASMPKLAEQPIEVAQGPALMKREADVAAPKLVVKPGLPEVQARATTPSLAQQPIQIAQVDRRKRQDQSPDVAAPTVSSKAGGPSAPQMQSSVAMPRFNPGVETQTHSSDGRIAAVPDISAQRSSQMIALNAHPADIRGPVELPNGNRRGEFASGPAGRPEASGAPATVTGSVGAHSSDANSTTAGITIAPGPKPSAAPTHVPVVSSPNAIAPRSGDMTVRDKLMAAARPTPDLPPLRTAREPHETPPTAIEKKVFGEKKYYTLTINMPNLNSSTGSWIIRFAELHPSGERGDLAAPVATSKADPAYPQDLMHDRVEGTVVLYAVIRADGSIGEVRVLNSVQDQLDSNAIVALRRWHFEPGSKNGKPVEVEAVVQVPFRVRKLAF